MRPDRARRQHRSISTGQEEQRITRSILEVLVEHRRPVGIVTKSALAERDFDFLSEMAKQNLVRKCGHADGTVGYFIEFLTLTGLWSRWQENYPSPYVSPNAPTKADVLGTWMLSILSAHKRYSHVTAIRFDGVNPGLLGMNKVISEDALRRALIATPEVDGVAWLGGHLNESVAPLLDAPWILDIDTTVKPLYGPFAQLSHLPHGRSAPGGGCGGPRGQRALGQPQPARTAEDTGRPAT